MQQLLIIALGGSAGAITRFLVANGIYAALGRAFPYGTLFINVSGSFLMGFLTELLLQRFALAAEYRAALLIGFLGAYTTFSTFALETMYLFEADNLFKAFLYIFLSVVLCVAACGFGLVGGRMLFAHDLYPWHGQNLPYLGALLSWLAVFVLAVLMETLLVRLNSSLEIKATLLILLLGLAAITTTIWLMLHLSASALGLQGLSTLFILNTLLATLLVGSGAWLGDWLCQLAVTD